MLWGKLEVGWRCEIGVLWIPVVGWKNLLVCSLVVRLFVWGMVGLFVKVMVVECKKLERNLVMCDYLWIGFGKGVEVWFWPDLLVGIVHRMSVVVEILIGVGNGHRERIGLWRNCKNSLLVGLIGWEWLAVMVVKKFVGWEVLEEPCEGIEGGFVKICGRHVGIPEWTWISCCSLVWSIVSTGMFVDLCVDLPNVVILMVFAEAIYCGHVSVVVQNFRPFLSFLVQLSLVPCAWLFPSLLVFWSNLSPVGLVLVAWLIWGQDLIGRVKEKEKVWEGDKKNFALVVNTNLMWIVGQIYNS